MGWVCDSPAYLGLWATKSAGKVFADATTGDTDGIMMLTSPSVSGGFYRLQVKDGDTASSLGTTIAGANDVMPIGNDGQSKNWYGIAAYFDSVADEVSVYLWFPKIAQRWIPLNKTFDSTDFTWPTALTSFGSLGWLAAVDSGAADMMVIAPFMAFSQTD